MAQLGTGACFLEKAFYTARGSFLGLSRIVGHRGGYCDSEFKTARFRLQQN